MPCICSVIDCRRHEDVVRIKLLRHTTLMPHVPLFDMTEQMDGNGGATK